MLYEVITEFVCGGVLERVSVVAALDGINAGVVPTSKDVLKVFLTF